MNPPTEFELAALAVGVIHFAVPLAYYEYLKRKVNGPWNLGLDLNFIPSTTVIVPTFNEATLIVEKLKNIKGQLFPNEKLQVVVVDSGSLDSTADIADRWTLTNPELKVTVVRESERKGKAPALNIGLARACGDVVVMTDADSQWSRGSLKEALSYFSDPSVGAVTGLKEPLVSNSHMSVESVGRSFYNIVRIGESKMHSTPIFNGELAAFRRGLLEQIGGFLTDVGADDSHMATLLALRGYRAIAVPEALAFELMPASWLDYVRWKRRRAAHLVQHFVRILRRVPQAYGRFRTVLAMEVFLHLVNPWLLLTALLTLAASITMRGFSLVTIIPLLFGSALLAFRHTREILLTWVMNQLILISAFQAALFSRQLTWTKINKVGPKGLISP